MRFYRFNFDVSHWSLCAILSILLVCVSCSPRQKFQDDEPGLPVQGIHASEKMILFLQNKMSHEGIRVITMGQNYLISIPSALIFQNESPNIRWKSYGLLNDVACYLQQFRKISVHINVFSPCYLSQHRTYALTLARARAVGDYIGSQGIDSRFIFTRGLANATPIVEHAKENDTSVNSRIEITFRSAVL